MRFDGASAGGETNFVATERVPSPTELTASESTPTTLKAFDKEIQELFETIFSESFQKEVRPYSTAEMALPTSQDIVESFNRTDEENKILDRVDVDISFDPIYRKLNLKNLLQIEFAHFLWWANRSGLFPDNHDASLDSKLGSLEGKLKFQVEKQLRTSLFQLRERLKECE